MYIVKYGNQYIHDPFSDTQRAYDVHISSDINASGTCEFTIGPSHPLYDKLELRSSSNNVTVLEDDTVLFDGYIYSFSTNYDKSRDVTCYGCLSYLGDIRLRPYATQQSDDDPPDMVYCSSTIDGLFEFYIDQYNKYAEEGRKFHMGTNEGSVIRELNSISASSDSYPTVSDELSEKLLNTVGGYVFIHHDGTDRYIDYFANCTDVNAQIVDFGVNIIDFVKTDTMSGFYTALRPVGGTPPESDEDKDKTEKPKRFPISLNLINDGPTDVTGIVKKGDVVYNEDAVTKYGYVEGYQSYSEITDVAALEHQAAIDIKIASSIHPTIEVKAIDLALYKQGNEPLVPGQLVRVRSIPHGIDEYLLLNNMDIDISDPSNTVYTFGEAIDSLTGEQNKKAAELNASINHSLDGVAELDQTIKDQAIAIGNAQQAADNAQNAADNAQNAADNAQNAADNAQNIANSNKEEIDSIKDAQTEYEKQLEQMQQGVADATEEIGQVNERIEGMGLEIESAKSDINALRSSTETELQNVKQSVSDVQSDVESVAQQASELASELDGTKATVEQVTTDLGEVKTTVSNAASKADQALQVSTSASQTATEAKTTATSAYQDAQSALTQSSTASQTANAVKTELETNYSTTDEIAEQYATKSLVEQTSQSITSTVEATYATKATVEALENIANNAVQTWMGSGVPTLSNKPASDWTTAELKSQHSGDIYYDSDTGYSYRFGSSDGKNYSWSLIKDTDISKAVADAAKAQQTAEGVSDEVAQLKTDIPATYATKTEVKQTTDSIKSSVSEVATTANSALSKATTVEQTAKGLQTTVTEQAEKLDGAVTTISQVSQKVDSVSSTITQVQGDIDRIDANSQNFITNPQFKQGNVDGVANTNMNATDSNPGVLPGTATTFGKNFSGYDNRADKVKIKFIKNHTYRIEIDARLASDNAYTGTEGLGLFFWFMTADNPGLSANQYTGYNANLIPSGTKEWTHASYDYTPKMGDDDPRIIFRPAYRVAPGSRWLVTNFTCTDVTAIAEAQKNADTATSTANSALSQSSTVKQELTSFKTSVQQTYETKNDALSKQSSLQQSVNNLRTEVSETYTTKTEFNNLQIGGTNLIQNSDFSRQGEEWAFGADGVTAEYGTDVSMGTYVKALCSSSGNRRFYQNVKDVWHKGEKLVYSFYAKSDDDTPPAIDLSRSLIDFGQKHTLSNTWTRYTGSITATDTPGTGTFSIRFVNTGVQTALITKIKLERGTKATDWSPAPEDMLSNAEAAQTYSTKSYVDQTARTVSLGVVEEYKNGQHGSALATQSDITAAKDSITSTVSQTYATKNDVGVGNLLTNGDFSSGTSHWVVQNGTMSVSDGSHGKRINVTLTGNNSSGECRVYNDSYNHIAGQAYEVSFYAFADKSSTWHFGPNRDSAAAKVQLDTTLRQYTLQYQPTLTYVFSVWTDNPTATIHLERVKLSIASGYYATKTEVKQTSDSLTVTISSAVSKAESAATAASNAQNIANAAAGSSTNYIKNGGPNGTSNPIVGWTISGNVYKHTFPGGQNHADIGYTTLAHPIVVGRKYRLSLDARVTSGTFSSSDYFVFGLANGWEVIRAQALTGSWKTYSGIVTSSKEATQVFTSSYVGSSGSKVVEMRNVSMIDVTETYNVASNAQSTANTANTNATNANNRVGNLETCIKMTADGVRVGKISNGDFTGYSALVNSAGSFDILDSSSNPVTSFQQNKVQFYSNGSKFGEMDLVNEHLQFGIRTERSDQAWASSLVMSSSYVGLGSDYGPINMVAKSGISIVGQAGPVEINGNSIVLYGPTTLRGNTTVLSGAYLSIANNATLRFVHSQVKDIIHGSTVITGNGTSHRQVLSSSQISSYGGYREGDFFQAWNGDYSANSSTIKGTSYHNGAFYVDFDTNMQGEYRVNWTWIKFSN